MRTRLSPLELLLWCAVLAGLLLSLASAYGCNPPPNPEPDANPCPDPNRPVLLCPPEGSTQPCKCVPE